MKRISAYISALLILTSSTMGCAKVEDGDDVFNSFDPTAQGLEVFRQALVIAVNPAGALVMAQNLNEYIEAPEESRTEVEDKYYMYYKVREVESGLWQIYDSKWTESYRLINGLGLDEKGAIWEVVRNPRFFGESDYLGNIRIQTPSADTHLLTLDNAMMGVHTSKSLLNTLERSANNRVNVYVSTELTVSTNRSDYESGESERLLYAIEGGGSFMEKENAGNGYRCEYEIVEPIVAGMTTSGFIDAPASGTMEVTVKKMGRIVGTVRAEMKNYAIYITYNYEGDEYSGYYDWAGNNISPRQNDGGRSIPARK